MVLVFYYRPHYQNFTLPQQEYLQKWRRLLLWTEQRHSPKLTTMSTSTFGTSMIFAAHIKIYTG